MPIALALHERSVTRTLKTIEHLLPVKADQLIGINIDRMHQDPKRVEESWLTWASNLTPP
ncbi:MAG: hypothetical protein R3B96_18015 [Pirellulaceae bacterium]